MNTEHPPSEGEGVAAVLCALLCPLHKQRHHVLLNPKAISVI